jgi:hypothetical protein
MSSGPGSSLLPDEGQAQGGVALGYRESGGYPRVCPRRVVSLTVHQGHRVGACVWRVTNGRAVPARVGPLARERACPVGLTKRRCRLDANGLVADEAERDAVDLYRWRPALLGGDELSRKVVDHGPAGLELRAATPVRREQQPDGDGEAHSRLVQKAKSVPARRSRETVLLWLQDRDCTRAIGPAPRKTVRRCGTPRTRVRPSARTRVSRSMGPTEPSAPRAAPACP